MYIDQEKYRIFAKQDARTPNSLEIRKREYNLRKQSTFLTDKPMVLVNEYKIRKKDYNYTLSVLNHHNYKNSQIKIRFSRNNSKLLLSIFRT